MATVSDVRQWARAQDIEVQRGGKLSKALIAAYNRANPDDPHVVKADGWGHPDATPADLEAQRRNPGSRRRPI